MDNKNAQEMPVSSPIIVHIINTNQKDVEVFLFEKDKIQKGITIEYIYPKETFKEYNIGRTYLTYHSLDNSMNQITLNQNGIISLLRLKDNKMMTMVSNKSFILNAETIISIVIPISTFVDSINRYTKTTLFLYPSILDFK